MADEKAVKIVKDVHTRWRYVRISEKLTNVYKGHYAQVIPSLTLCFSSRSTKTKTMPFLRVKNAPQVANERNGCIRSIPHPSNRRYRPKNQRNIHSIRDIAAIYLYSEVARNINIGVYNTAAVPFDESSTTGSCPRNPDTLESSLQTIGTPNLRFLRTLGARSLSLRCLIRSLVDCSRRRRCSLNRSTP